jgi:hypothetical protein
VGQVVGTGFKGGCLREGKRHEDSTRRAKRHTGEKGAMSLCGGAMGGKGMGGERVRPGCNCG